MPNLGRNLWVDQTWITEAEALRQLENRVASAAGLVSPFGSGDIRAALYEQFTAQKAEQLEAVEKAERVVNDRDIARLQMFLDSGDVAAIKQKHGGDFYYYRSPRREGVVMMNSSPYTSGAICYSTKRTIVGEKSKKIELEPLLKEWAKREGKSLEWKAGVDGISFSRCRALYYYHMDGRGDGDDTVLVSLAELAPLHLPQEEEDEEEHEHCCTDCCDYCSDEDDDEEDY
jgi:hypothetical protein